MACTAVGVATTGLHSVSTHAIPTRSLDRPNRPQVAWLCGQQHDAVGIEPLRLEGVDASQDLIRFQVDHRDGPVAHDVEIEEVFWTHR